MLRLDTFYADVRSTVLLGFSTASAALVTAADSVLAAIGKLQAQNGVQGIATLDFGATAANDATVTITGQSAILSTSILRVWADEAVTIDNTAQDHRQLAWSAKFSGQNIIPGVGFDIEAMLLVGQATGTFTINWNWN
jgi:hypothetical protein